MSDLLYRKSLAEKLKDLSGELKTGRDSFTWNSGLYNKLNKSINAVLEVLDDHSGEEWLSDEVKKDLEDKIKKMKDAAIPYSEEKLRQGALADGGLSSRSNEAQYIIRKRFQAAIDILKVDSKIPNDPGVEEGIVRPDVLEEGDQLETDWRLKWKQNVRYLAKKQIYTYEKKLEEYRPTDRVTQEEFDALMDLVMPSMLSYKHDAKLCQMYPELRLNLEKAIHASEKINNLSDEEIASFMNSWSTRTMEKSIKAAKKAKERQGQVFTEQDRKNIVEKQKILIQDKTNKYMSREKLISKGDKLYEVARFVDLKMKVISNKKYVKLLHTNTLGRIFSVTDYEDLARHAEDDNEKEFYTNLRDIRELEDAGIRHKKPVTGLEEALYKKVDETVHRTVKREFLGFRVGKPGFKGIAISNAEFGAENSSTTTNQINYGQDSKLRVGKIGIKFHSKHKSLQLSSGVAFGQVKTSSIIGANLNGSGINMIMAGEASAIRGRIKGKASNKYVGATLGANASVGHASAKAVASFGNIQVKDPEGKEHSEFGFNVKAGAVATAFKGGGSGSVNILGLKIGLSFTTYAAGVGVDVGAEASVGGVGFSLGGALGIGAGLAININWSEAVSRLKSKWRKSKLRKLIKKHKNKKELKKTVKNMGDSDIGIGRESVKVIQKEISKKKTEDAIKVPKRFGK